MMVSPPGPLLPNALKRGRVGEASDTRCEHSQTAKRQKREQTPPAFWNSISRVPLCRRALREFERRLQVTKPPKPPKRIEVKRDHKQELKRFARHGGPDCQDIIAYPDKHESPKHAAEMSARGSRSRRSGRGSGSTSSSRPRSTEEPPATTLSSKDAAFEQTLIDHHILTGRGTKPENWKAISERLKVPRASLSPSRFTEEHYQTFQTCNEEAKSELDVMTKVIPKIANNNHRSLSNRQFTNLSAIAGSKTKPAQPDLYEGTLPSYLDREVRRDLSVYIVPSGHTEEPLLPNHFTEVKGPQGNAYHMRLQAIYDAAHGARAMHQILSYGQDEQQYNGNARSFASTYHSGTSTLQMYATHATAPTEAGGDPTYKISQIGGFYMQGNYDTCVAGLTAYRNIQDLAKEERDNAIALANDVARNRNLESITESPNTSLTTTGDDTLMSSMATSSNQVESDDTSADELARDTSPPAKRTPRTSKLTSPSKRSRTTITRT